MLSSMDQKREEGRRERERQRERERDRKCMIQRALTKFIFGPASKFIS